VLRTRCLAQDAAVLGRDEWLATLRRLLALVPLTAETHDLGLHLARRHQLSIYDAMIVASALEAQCETLWTEDLADGAVFEERLRVSNPFG
jgi:predicted nucleic acid-binding protein